MKHWADKTEEEFTVPIQIYKSLLEIVEQSGMRHWNEKKGVSLDGAKYVFKFQKGNTLERVSTDNMPENGEVIFTKLLSVFNYYAKNNQVKE